MKTNIKLKGAFGIAALMVLAASAAAQDAHADTDKKDDAKIQKGGAEDLTNLNLDDLAKMNVTTASKKSESLFGVGASISVVTAEDIKRKGAINIPEALRGLPGVQVAQIDSSNYAVSVRGNNGLYAEKLLVLIDGRSIYNSLYGGVYWQDYAISMEEIERIEVIRGPGGTLWGANAMNGIINIITKNAKDTQGGLAQVEAGDQNALGRSTLRYGTKLGNGYLRLTDFGAKNGQTLNATGDKVGDDWTGNRLSFRYDGGTDKQKLFVAGDYHKFDFRSYQDLTGTAGSNYPSYGGNILAKLDLNHSNGSSDAIQMFYDTYNDRINGSVPVRSATLDLDYQHSFADWGKHSVVVGAGARYIADDYSGGYQLLDKERRKMGVLSAFIQDEIKLNAKSKLSIGTKMLHNEFTGWEFQPSIRFATQPDENHAIWASLSRAVRTPTQAQDSIGITIPGSPAWAALSGDDHLKSVGLVAAEAGYRVNVGKKMTVDASVFHNNYDHIDSFLPGTPTMVAAPFPHAVVPITLANTGNAKTYGFELSSKIQATDKWRLDLGYSFLDVDLPANSTTWDAPKHQASLLSTYEINSKFSFDNAIYFAGKNIDTPQDSTTRFDLQLRYRASDRFELSVGGRNLGEGNYRQEPAGLLATGTYIRPQVFLKATWKF